MFAYEKSTYENNQKKNKNYIQRSLNNKKKRNKKLKKERNKQKKTKRSLILWKYKRIIYLWNLI